MKPLVLAFAGGIASGKSTLSSRVSRDLGWPRVSFGDYVRRVARERQMEERREVLQELGASLINEGWEQFVHGVLAQVCWAPGEPLVIDGVRHAGAVQTLRLVVAPSELLLAFVVVSEAAARARLRERGMGTETLSGVLSHSTEAQVNTVLPGMADLIIDGSRPVAELVPEILAWISRYAAPTATDC